MTDQELLTRHSRGDLRALESILDRYETPLLRFATRLCWGRPGARELAEDVVQETFLRLVRESGSLGSVGSLSAWLYRVARNLAIDASRKEVRMERRDRLAAQAEAEPPVPCEAEREETNGIIARKLFSLPRNQRDVLILKVQEGKSYREISEITGLTTSNVGWLIHQGLKSLAEELRTAGVV